MVEAIDPIKNSQAIYSGPFSKYSTIPFNIKITSSTTSTLRPPLWYFLRDTRGLFAPCGDVVYQQNFRLAE